MAPRFIDTYLDNPIIRNGRDLFLLHLLEARSSGPPPLKTKGRKRLLQALEYIGHSEIHGLEPDDYYPLDKVLEPCDHFSECLESVPLVKRMSERVKTGLGNWGIQPDDRIFPMPEIPNDDYLRHCYNHMRFFEQFVNKVAVTRARGAKGMVETKEEHASLYGDEYYCFLALDAIDVIYLLSYTQVLMFKDMYYARFNSILASHLLDPSGQLRAVIIDCFDWFVSCLTRYGNKGYEIAKSIEALAKTNLIRKTDPILGLEGSHQEMLQVVRDKEGTLGTTSNFSVDALEVILRRQRPVETDVELFGLQKLSGHPLIDPAVGGEKVLGIIRDRPLFQANKVQRIRNNFCRMYTEGYIRRNHRWPPLSFSPHARETRLYQLYSLHELKILPSSYPLADWEGVRFEKDYDFDFFPNFTDLMDDRAISYYRDQLGATWDPSISTRSHRKLLLEMLSRKEIDVRSIVDRVRCNDIPFSWKIVSLYPKEREFKLCPRMFGMMVFEMRAFFTATEANLAESIFPNIPPQTMTLDKTEVQELFNMVTSPLTGEAVTRLNGEFDMSSWNLRFRPEVVDPIGYDLEDLFGLPGAFTVIHHFFAECVMLVRVKDCEPTHWKEAQVEGGFLEAMSDSLHWIGHEPGIEGLSQKHWALATYSFIDLGLSKFGFPYYLIGQADNQIYFMQVSHGPEEDISKKLRELSASCQEAVAEECKNAGHVLNLDECLASTTLITYSKNVYISGVEYFTSIKACSRIFPHAAADFPTIINSVGSVTGQCLAAAESLKNPMIAMILSWFHTILYLTTLQARRPVETIRLPNSTWKHLTENMIMALLSYPGELGGMPVGHFYGFLYKGGADPLSKAYASLSLLFNTSTVVRRIFHSLHSGRWMSKEPDLNLLLEDPYSLPIIRARTPEMTILKRSMEVVATLTKNRELEELFSLEVGKYEVELVRTLLSCRPFNPILLADIKGWSITGVRRLAAKMFTSTQTIQALLQDDGELNPCASILVSGANQFYSLVSRLSKMKGVESSPLSVYEGVQALRAFWKIPDGSSVTGVSTYTPFDSPVEVSLTPTTTPGFKLIFNSAGDAHPWYGRGPFPPYLGKATQEKRSQHGYKIITSSAPERAVKRLVDIAIQPGIGASLLDVLENVAATRCNASVKQTAGYVGSIYGGTLVHRYASRFGHRKASLLGVGTLATHCQLNTDYASPFSGGDEDYPRMIQEDMVALIGIVNLVISPSSKRVFITLRTDTQPYLPFIDAELKVGEPLVAPAPIFPENRVAYSPHLVLIRTGGVPLSPLISPMGDASTGLPDFRYAIQRTFRRAMARSSTAYAVADRGAGKIHTHIDIAEARGCGLETILMSASLEIGRFALDVTYSRGTTELRWSPAPVVQSLSLGLAGSIAALAVSPHLREDPWVITHWVHTGLRYTLGPRSLAQKISDQIATKALIWLMDPSSPVYTESIVMFFDEPRGEGERSVLSTLRSIFTQCLLLGELDPLPVYQILRRNVTASLAGFKDEIQRLGRFYTLISNLAEWAWSCHFLNLHSRLTTLLQGRDIKILQIPCAEALRMARSVKVRDDRQPGVTHIHSPLPLLMDSRARMFALGPEGPLLTLPRWITYHHSQAYELFSARRLSGRVYGVDSTTGYSYSVISSLCEQKVVVMIGCGAGSGAAVALLKGCSMVIGLDLLGDMDEQESFSGPIIPVAVQAVNLGHKFVRFETDDRVTGDIRRSSTGARLKTYVGNGALYVIDIPLNTRADIYDTLNTICLVELSPVILIRFLGTKAETYELGALLFAWGGELEVYPVYHADEFCEIWLKTKLKGTPPGVGRSVSWIDFACMPVLDHACIQKLGGGREQVCSNLYGPYSSLNSGDMGISAETLLRMVGASVGSLDHRYTYHQWTSLLHALAARKIEQSDHWLSDIQDYLDEGEIQVTVGERTIRVNSSERLTRLLTRTLPRLMPQVRD